MQIGTKLALGLFALVAAFALIVAASSAQNRLVPELPVTSTPVTLVAAINGLTGRSEFRYAGNSVPPVIRVQPGSAVNIEYKNELTAQSREECLDHPCTNMTNLHFHGLHVSPNAPQDDVLEMMAMPGETLHYFVEVLV